jgi:23S rRNA-/tRNA-specific pseudouridylate synthase
VSESPGARCSIPRGSFNWSIPASKIHQVRHENAWKISIQHRDSHTSGCVLHSRKSSTANEFMKSWVSGSPRCNLFPCLIITSTQRL